jgi:hypothetical protein
MIETTLIIACIVIVAILVFILIDRAGQPDPIPLILKLIVLIVALVAISRALGYYSL